jgi:hypothetical protein
MAQGRLLEDMLYGLQECSRLLSGERVQQHGAGGEN